MDNHVSFGNIVFGLASAQHSTGFVGCAKKLQEEVLRLKCELKREKLRADFYEEMVAFGKEVYGIDLKKAGTK